MLVKIRNSDAVLEHESRALADPGALSARPAPRRRLLDSSGLRGRPAARLLDVRRAGRRARSRPSRRAQLRSGPVLDPLVGAACQSGRSRFPAESAGARLQEEVLGAGGANVKRIKQQGGKQCPRLGFSRTTEIYAASPKVTPSIAGPEI